MSSKPNHEPIRASQSRSADSDAKTDPDLLARLKALEADLEKERETNARLRQEADEIANAAGMRYQPNAKAFAGPEGYEFRVTPILKDGETDFAHLKPRTIKAVDEGEAKRWYCQANEMRPGNGMALDPMRVRLEVQCLSESRADSIMRQKQVSALRKKVEAGQQLSENDTALLAEVEDEIYGY